MQVGKALTNLSGMLMGRAILTLKKVAGSALSKMQMGVNGRGLEKIYKSITLLVMTIQVTLKPISTVQGTASSR